MRKRITACIIAILSCMLLIASPVYADIQAPCNLSIIMEYNELPLEGIKLEICQVADIIQDNDGIYFEPLPAFSVLGLDLTDLSNEKNTALAEVVDKHAALHGIARSSAVTDSSGIAVFRGLPAGLYLVTQQDGIHSEYIIAPYLIAVVSTVKGNEVVSYPKSELVKNDTDLISVSVYKIWVGTETPPGSVLVQLYQNGAPYESAVTLSAQNGWSYTWKNLDPSESWTVDEPFVPQGYTREISGNVGSGFVITNTKEGAVKPPGNSRPNTNDSSNIIFWIIIAGTSSILLFVMFAGPKSKRRFYWKDKG